MTNYKTQMKKSNFSVEIYIESWVNPSVSNAIFDVNITTAKKHAKKYLTGYHTKSVIRMCVTDNYHGIRYEYNLNKKRFCKGVYI